MRTSLTPLLVLPPWVSILRLAAYNFESTAGMNKQQCIDYLQHVLALPDHDLITLANRTHDIQYYYIHHARHGATQHLSPPFSVVPPVCDLLSMNFVIPSRSFQDHCVHCKQALDGPGADYCRSCKKDSYVKCTKCAPATYQLVTMSPDGNSTLPSYCPAHGLLSQSIGVPPTSSSAAITKKTYMTPELCTGTALGREIEAPPGSNQWWYIPPIPGEPPRQPGIKFYTATSIFFVIFLHSSRICVR